MSLAPLPKPAYCIASSSHFHVVGISVSETVLDTNLRLHRRLVMLAIASHSSVPDLLKDLQVRILLKPFASTPEGPPEPLVNNNNNKINYYYLLLFDIIVVFVVN